MRKFTWKYTQFSQFNSSDTLLLVSGVHFGSLSTSGEIAVFSLEGKYKFSVGAQWLSGRVLDSRPRGRRFEPHFVVLLEQDTFILAW